MREVVDDLVVVDDPARLDLGDCFSYATATLADAPLLFKDEDFARTDVASVL